MKRSPTETVIINASDVHHESLHWCEHFGGLGPPFPLCEVCANKYRKETNAAAGSGGMSDTLAVDRNARWQEIQRFARRIAESSDAPTEIESALCWAVTGAKDAAAEIERLRAELEAARRDAERYQWLRDREHGIYWAPPFYPATDAIIPGEWAHSEDLDAAIDAAIKESGHDKGRT